MADQDVWLREAWSHHQSGNLPAAELLYRKILQREPNYKQAVFLLGTLCLQRQDFDTAVAHLNRAVALDPDNAEAHDNLGVALRKQNRLEEALASCTRALQLNPNQAGAHNNRGGILRAMGRPAEAMASYDAALQLRPDYPDVYRNMAIALTGLGKLDEAERASRRALELDPEGRAGYVSLAMVLHHAGRDAQEAECYRQLLSRHPQDAEALTNLGDCLHRLGELDAAAATCQRALLIKPDYAEAHGNLGNALQNQGKLEEAVASYERALQIKPDYATAHCNLGAALASQGKLDAAASYQRALQIKPDYAAAHSNLGNMLRDQGKLEAAAASYQRALQIKPDYAVAHSNLGSVLSDQGKLDEAVASYRRAVQSQPDYVDAHSNLIMTEHYLPGVSLVDLEASHAAWNRQHAESLKSQWRPFTHLRDPQRPLRLGFVSPDLRRHPVAYFFVRCLEALKPERCQTVCYSDRVGKDDLTARMAASAEIWRDVKGLSDETLAEQIREDQIDVLFDLAGHTANNRLLVFARKPAPIQVTWIGYVGTTGLSAIDYLFADRFHIPQGAETHFQEQVIRLPDARFCYDPPDKAPNVGPLPAKLNGSVTFGSFNSPAKVTPQVLATWAKILRLVPGARLILKYRGLDDSGTAERYLRLFADLEVQPDQIELRGSSPYDQMLDEYNEIDLALDPYPFCGATTTCEALWMGVPVVTCPMQTFASRQTLCILSNIGVTETVASDPSHYVQLAVEMASNLPHLAELRAGLRQKMAQSPLCDASRFATSFMQATRDIWSRWCQTER